MMKKPTLLFALLLFLASCHKLVINPSWDISSEIRPMDFFNQIDVRNAIKVEIIQDISQQQTVVVETNSNLQKYVITEVKSGKLIIRLKKDIRIRKNPTIKVYVTVNDLNEIQISDASNIDFNGTFTCKTMKMNASGASRIQGDVFINNLDLHLSGASELKLYGQIGKLNAKLSGASSLKDFDLNIDALVVELSGASQGRVTVNHSIDIEASGASTLYYKGNPTINSIELSGASNIKKNG
jgi:hypothetical protein